MSYVAKHLIPGETLLYRTGLHWVVLLPPAFVGVCLAATGIAVPIVVARTKHEPVSPPLVIVGSVLFVTGVIFIVSGMLRRGATEIGVTNKRVIIKTGFATRHTLELLLSQVESIVVNEPLTGRILGYGTVIVRGTGGTPEPFDRIARPLEFRRQVQHQIEIAHS